MNRFRISTPEGTRDLLFSSCRALRQTENAVRDALEERGYSEIITPAVEYFDVFAQANPELDQDQMLKIIDKSGRICVARPDNTTPIARIAATRLDDAALPVRLYYSQKVFRSVSGDHGHKGEFLQVGAEFIGADGLEADKDILSAAFAALSKTGADNFRVELGHAEIYKALMDELGADAQSAEGIRRLIENKSFAALGDALEPFKGKPAAKALSAMPNLFGGIEVLDEVESLTGNVRVLGATAYLRRLYQALDEAGYGDRIMIDLGLVHEMDYYTGIMFRGYIGGAGAAILAGGRYNALCAKFGKDMPAGGFGIDVESVADSLAGQSRPEVATRRDTVRIALTKGRLEKKTLALLKAAGYDISELEAGTRKLIFTLPDSGVEIVLSKAADVITYVEHGVCDMGVVGKDTIMAFLQLVAGVLTVEYHRGRTPLLDFIECVPDDVVRLCFGQTLLDRIRQRVQRQHAAAGRRIHLPHLHVLGVLVAQMTAIGQVERRTRYRQVLTVNIVELAQLSCRDGIAVFLAHLTVRIGQQSGIPAVFAMKAIRNKIGCAQQIEHRVIA